MQRIHLNLVIPLSICNSPHRSSFNNYTNTQQGSFVGRIKNLPFNKLSLHGG